MFVFTLIPSGLYLGVILLLKGPLSPYPIILLWGGAVYLYLFRNKTAMLLLLTLSILIAGGRILLIPGSVYMAWYQLLERGEAEGSVSSVFAMTAAILSYPGYIIFLSGSRRKGLLYLLISQTILLVLVYPGIISALVLFVLTGLLFYQNTPPGERGIWITGWIPLILILPVLFSLIPPSPGEVKGSPLVDTLSNSLREGMLDLFPDYPLLFNLPGYGTGYKSSAGGGRPVLTPAPLFRIEGTPGESLYLKTESFTVFSGKTWISEPAVQLLPGGESRTDRESRSRALTVLCEYSRRLPYTETTDRISIGEDVYTLEHPWRSSLELPEGYPLKQGAVIILTEEKPHLPEPLPGEEYTFLPDRTISEFSAMAELFRRENPVDTVRLIRNYLLREYTYTLETEAKEYPLSHFLKESRKGYCVHFASAFAVLARINGIPVRLAEGYRVSIPREGPEERRGHDRTTVNITGYASHRWPEIYLPGRGWIIVEVTPPFTDEDDTILDAEDRLTRALLTDLGVPLPEKEEADPGKDKKPVLSFGFFLLLFGPVMLVLPVLLIIYLRRTRLIRTVRKSVAHYENTGIPSPATTGWAAWVDSVAGKSRTVRIKKETFLKALLAYEYGPDEPEGEKRIILETLKNDRSARGKRGRFRSDSICLLHFP